MAESFDWSTVTVPANALGVTIVATTTDGSEWGIRLARLGAPSGDLVINGSVASNDFDVTWPGALAFAQPQVEHPETFPFMPGLWSFKINSNASLEGAAWLRLTVDGRFHGGVLDVNLFRAGTELSDEELAERVAIAFDGWAGLSLGDVRVFDVAPTDQLEITSMAPTFPALNVLALGDYDGPFGYSAGIPGVATKHGTTGSGVVWGTTKDVSPTPTYCVTRPATSRGCSTPPSLTQRRRIRSRIHHGAPT